MATPAFLTLLWKFSVQKLSLGLGLGVYPRNIWGPVLAGKARKPAAWKLHGVTGVLKILKAFLGPFISVKVKPSVIFSILRGDIGKSCLLGAGAFEETSPWYSKLRWFNRMTQQKGLTLSHFWTLIIFSNLCCFKIPNHRVFQAG